MITLFGHGYVGHHIAQELERQGVEYRWLSHKNYLHAKGEVIINAAGHTGVPNVDACENEKQATINGNVLFPMSLEAAYPHSRIIHITSGCVYTGYKDGGWTEYHQPNFNFDNGSFYSASKTLFQELMNVYLDKSYLLRIRLPFGDEHNPKNYLTKLAKYDKLVDFENSVSYVNDVASVAVFFARQLPQPGIYNVCNPGTITTKQVANMMGLQKEWYTQEEFMNSVTAPRSNCNMSSFKLSEIFPIQTAESALQQAIGRLNNA